MQGIYNLAIMTFLPRISTDEKVSAGNSVFDTIWMLFVSESENVYFSFS